MVVHINTWVDPCLTDSSRRRNINSLLPLGCKELDVSNVADHNITHQHCVYIIEFISVNAHHFLLPNEGTTLVINLKKCEPVLRNCSGWYSTNPFPLLLRTSVFKLTHTHLSRTMSSLVIIKIIFGYRDISNMSWGK